MSPRRCKTCGEVKPAGKYGPAELRKGKPACRSCRSRAYREYRSRRREREHAAAGDSEEPHPVTTRTGSRSGARQIRRGGHLLGPMEFAAAERRREAIEAARANGVEYVERDGRTFTLLHLPAELEASQQRDMSEPVRPHAPRVAVDVFS
jgi:hypothetical protein